MAVAVDIKPWTERRRRVAELRARQGFARQLLDFYRALLGVQERAYLNAASSRPSADKLASYVADMVVPAVVDVSLFAGPDQLRGQLTDRLETEQPALKRQRVQHRSRRIGHEIRLGPVEVDDPDSLRLDARELGKSRRRTHQTRERQRARTNVLIGPGQDGGMLPQIKKGGSKRTRPLCAFNRERPMPRSSGSSAPSRTPSTPPRLEAPYSRAPPADCHVRAQGGSRRGQAP